MPPSESDSHPEIVEAGTQYRYLALFGTAVFAAFVIGLLTAVAFAVATAANVGADQVRYLIALFGLLVGIYSILFAFYFLFAPRVELPFTPTKQPPDRWPLLLFGIGTVLILSNLRVFSADDSVVFFWRVAGLALAASLVTGVSVYVVLQHTGFQGFERHNIP